MSIETVERKRRIGHRAWVAIGLSSAVVGFFFVPVLFGPLAILAGIMVFRNFDEWHGVALIVFGVLSTVVGFIIGVLSMLFI